MTIAAQRLASAARKRTAAGLARLRPPQRAGLEKRKVLVNAEFDRELEMVPRARRCVVTELRRAGCHHLVDDAELLACELFTNAVRYGAGPQAAITVERGDSDLWIAVESDPGGTSPIVRVASEQDENGRGLFLVKSYSTAFGNEITPSGAHRTWCLLRDPQPDH